jgi:hypothetical protein
MTTLDWAQVIFLAIVASVSLYGMIKVIFFDKDEPK